MYRLIVLGVRLSQVLSLGLDRENGSLLGFLLDDSRTSEERHITLINP
jgi:hypothetical protein